MARARYGDHAADLARDLVFEPVDAFVVDQAGRVIVCERCEAPLSASDHFEVAAMHFSLLLGEPAAGLSGVGAAHVWSPRPMPAGRLRRWWAWLRLPREVLGAELQLMRDPCLQLSPTMRQLVGR